MSVKRAMLEIESTGQPAWFEAEVKLPSDEIVGPALVVEVVDFTEALEVVETLNRSRAQRKRERKPAETTAPMPVQATNGRRQKDKTDPQQEQGGDPYEREKAAAAAIEDDRPF